MLGPDLLGTALHLNSRPPKFDSVEVMGYTKSMKTAVSIPDDLFDEAEVLARELKTSRSAIYARALAAFIDTHDPDRVTEAMNKVVDAVKPERDPFVAAAARRVLDSVEW